MSIAFWNSCSRARLVCWWIVCAGCTGGRHQAPSDGGPPTPPKVQVANPIVATSTPALTFTGRTAAINRVDVQARVSGYLEKISFADGALVNRGDVLFQIDPRPYRASLAQAEAALAEAKAALGKADADLRRAEPLVASRAISREEYDLRTAQRDASVASVASAEARVDAARLDLEFTTITAPISGRIGRANVTIGNLISEAQNLVLTTIVQVDPVYVEFDVDERSLLAVKASRAQQNQQIEAGDVSAEKIPIEVGLASDDGFPHAGFLNFVDNRVDAATGTLLVRGVLSNPESPFLPGLFVRVRVPTGAPRQGTFVADRALGIDQGQRFVYVVDDANLVQYRAVKVGGREQGLRLIESPLDAGARVVINGLQRVRPGQAVTPQQVRMSDFVAEQAARETAPKRSDAPASTDPPAPGA